MGKISGYVNINLTKAAGDLESISVDGAEFGLEEGGDWSRDHDDGSLYAGFLFIAFCEGFDLLLNIHIHGNSITQYNLSIRQRDLEEFEIRSVSVANDALDVSNLFPSEEHDDY